MPEPHGPWSSQTPPKAPAPRRRPPIGLLVWLGLLAAGGAAYWALSQLFPGQVTGMDQTNALYAIGLLALVSSGLVFATRFRLREVVRNMAIWFAIGAAILVGYSFRGEAVGVFNRVRGELIPSYAVPISNRELVLTASADGHFYVMGQVNGAPTRFIIDTGATEVVLSPQDAQRAGVDLSRLDFGSPGETANGVGYVAPLRLASLAVGPLRLEGVTVGVNKTPMSASLLGMSFLRQVDIQTRGDQMTLRWRN